MLATVEPPVAVPEPGALPQPLLVQPEPPAVPRPLPPRQRPVDDVLDVAREALERPQPCPDNGVAVEDAVVEERDFTFVVLPSPVPAESEDVGPCRDSREGLVRDPDLRREVVHHGEPLCPVGTRRLGLGVFADGHFPAPTWCSVRQPPGGPYSRLGPSCGRPG